MAAPVLRLLMVCTGNICRSPTAEGVLRAKLAAAGLGAHVEVDSAGTHGYHVREAPDPRAQAHALRRGYDLSGLRARRVVDEDFSRFHRLLAMDDDHLTWLRSQAPAGSPGRVELFMTPARRFSGQGVVPDPYYGPAEGFERVLDLIEDACDGWVARLQRELDGAGGVS